MGEEEEGKEAELLPQLDLRREACVDGGERRRLGQLTAMAPFRVRVRCEGEKGGGERAEVVGVLFILHGGPGREEEAGDATATRRPWRQCFPCRHRKKKGERETGGGPPVRILFFSHFPEIPVGFW